MDSNDIRKILRAKCRTTFVGVYASDRLPARLPARRPILLVANTDPHFKPGQHWIAIYFGRDNRGEYFDSLGRPPSEIFRRYMDRMCVVWTREDRQLQSAASRFCGHYAIFFCLLKTLGHSSNSIYGQFTHDTGLNDVIAHGFVCKLL